MNKDKLEKLIENVKNDKNKKIDPLYLPREVIESHYDELKYAINDGVCGVIGMK